MASIRIANPFDMPVLLDMLRSYREQTPLEFLREANDAQYITKLLSEFIAGRGVIFVAETDKVIGMLIAQIAPSIWSPTHLIMTELAYWVEPEARGSTAGYRLLKAYERYGEALKHEKRIVSFVISKMINSPDLQYQKFGFEKLEEFWVN